MTVSRRNILKKMEKEIEMANQFVDSKEEMKKYVSRITMLCDLLLEDTSDEHLIKTDESKKVEITEEDAWVVGQNYHKETEESEHDPYDIFDF